MCISDNVFNYVCRVTALLDEAERKTKRSLRAASLYKDEITRLTPSKSSKKKPTPEELRSMNSDGVRKEKEIERMRIEISELQAKMNQEKSRTCIIS